MLVLKLLSTTQIQKCIHYFAKKFPSDRLQIETLKHNSYLSSFRSLTVSSPVTSWKLSEWRVTVPFNIIHRLSSHIHSVQCHPHYIDIVEGKIHYFMTMMINISQHVSPWFKITGAHDWVLCRLQY